MDEGIVKKIANLARLELADAEVKLYGKQMDRIIEMFDAISEVDTDGVAPMTNVHDTVQHPVEDTVSASLSTHKILANAPAVDESYIKVPLVLKRMEK